jgi:hypothetical protein
MLIACKTHFFVIFAVETSDLMVIKQYASDMFNSGSFAPVIE